MKMRKFKIRFQTLDETLRDFTKDWKSIEKGGKPTRLVASGNPLVIMDHSMFSKIFSAERMRIIQMIQQKHPASVTELAQLLNREQANVHRDVHFLAELGILELTRIKEEGKAEAVRPEFHWAGFDIELDTAA